MSATAKSLGIDKLALDERLALVEEIWDSIAAESEAVPLTAEQRAELQQRIIEDDALPNATTSWNDIRAATLAKFGK